MYGPFYFVRCRSLMNYAAHLFATARGGWSGISVEKIWSEVRERDASTVAYTSMRRVHIPCRSKRLFNPHLFPHPQTSKRIICLWAPLVGTTANKRGAATDFFFSPQTQPRRRSKIEDRGLWIEDRITRYNAIFNLQSSIFDLRCLLWDSRIPTHERW
jgi:hypothetical protein